MSVSESMITRFGTPVTVTRKGAGTYTNGVFTPGTTTAISTVASVQPLSGKEMASLPELERVTGMFKAYFFIEVFTSDDQAGKPADVVSFASKAYRVKSVEPWGPDLAFFKAILVRVAG